MAKPQVKIDTSNFSAAMRQLAEITGFSRRIKEVITSETHEIYSNALRRTGPKRSASRAKIAEAHTLNPTAAGKKRLVRYLYLGGRKVRTRGIQEKGSWKENAYGGRYFDPDTKNPDWALAQKKLRDLKKLRQTRVGLSKWSWVHMAKTARIKPLRSVPAYVSKAGASASGTNFKQFFSSKAQGRRSGFNVTLEHRADAQVGARTKTAFLISMNARVTHFRISVRKGVFEDARARSQRYGFLATEN